MRFLREIFSKKLRELIDKSGYTKVKVSELVNVEPPQISRWCSGDTFPSEENYEKLKRIFNVNDDYFYNSSSTLENNKNTLEFFRKKLDEKDDLIKKLSEQKTDLNEAETSLIKVFRSFEDPEKAINLIVIFNSLGFLKDFIDELDKKLIIGAYAGGNNLDLKKNDKAKLASKI